MQESTDRNFLAFVDDDGSFSFINLELVRMVDEIRHHHCRLWFSEAHKVEIHGNGATFFIQRFGSRSITPTGELLNLGNLTSE